MVQVRTAPDASSRTSAVRPNEKTLSSVLAVSTTTALRSHEVLNQPPPSDGLNLFDSDPALREALVREGGAWGEDRARDLGALAGSAEAREHSRRAQRNIPVLHTHDRYGHRVDRVEY